MSGEDLRVSSAHLGELAGRQAQAAGEVRTASLPADGAVAEVNSTHGSIAAATSSALKAVLASRQTAGTTVAGVSVALSGTLTASAARYDQTDSEAGSALDSQMRPGQS
ncbi:hypothetical protein A5663_16370 [Mycobacterium sp. E740]|nr:hypothetical protein A5663_16370 [Mycobacterium sp. E740]